MKTFQLLLIIGAALGLTAYASHLNSQVRNLTERLQVVENGLQPQNTKPLDDIKQRIQKLEATSAMQARIVPVAVDPAPRISSLEQRIHNIETTLSPHIERIAQ